MTKQQALEKIPELEKLHESMWLEVNRLEKKYKDYTARWCKVYTELSKLKTFVEMTEK